MMNEPTVFLVDADKSTRKAVCDLASTMNLRCEAFALGQEFLDSYTPSQSGCLVLEVRIPDVNGLDIQDHLRAQGAVIPVVFLTGRATVSIAVRAMRTGAMHFLEKPFRDHELWDAIHEAIVLDEKRRRALKERQERERELAAITLKERHVLKMIAEGKSKAAMASEAGVSVRAIELRRNRVMKKLGLTSVVELVHFALTTCNGYCRWQAIGTRASCDDSADPAFCDEDSAVGREHDAICGRIVRPC